MQIDVVRVTTTRDAIFGSLSVNGVFECDTLENRDLCIPLGTYPVQIYDSPHAGHPVPILENVPGRDYIEIHCGNLSQDCKGCILLGQSYTQDSLVDSRLAFDHLFPQIQAAIAQGETVTLTLS